MSDHTQRPQQVSRGLPPEQLDDDARELFVQLGDIRQHQPSDAMRRQFYQRLGNAQASASGQSWREWFGWLSHPLVPAALTLALGLGVGLLGGQRLGDRADDGEMAANNNSAQLNALQHQVAELNAKVALNLMQNAAISERLSGVQLASGLDDAGVRQALLSRAAQDDSQSVRSAAVAALGPHLSEPEVWRELQQLMLATEEPLVQLALVDLVMRWGEQDQLDHLITATNEARLLPDVNDYVQAKLEDNI